MRALRLFDQTMSYRAQNDETTTKASTPTEECLINDRLASELSLYDDDVTFNSLRGFLKSSSIRSIAIARYWSFYYKGALCTARVVYTRHWGCTGQLTGARYNLHEFKYCTRLPNHLQTKKFY